MIGSPNEMQHEMQHQLLDLLVDGPSSFAALYSALRRHYGYGTLDVDVVADALRVMERLGWVRARQMTEAGGFRAVTDDDRAHAQAAYQRWLPQAVTSEVSLDDVGMWFELESMGRREWTNWSKEQGGGPQPRWVLDDLSDSCTISIRADSAAAAENALRMWLSLNPGEELIEHSKAVEPLREFELRDKSVITNGVRLVCRYKKGSSPTAARRD